MTTWLFNTVENRLDRPLSPPELDRYLKYFDVRENLKWLENAGSCRTVLRDRRQVSTLEKCAVSALVRLQAALVAGAETTTAARVEAIFLHHEPAIVRHLPMRFAAASLVDVPEDESFLTLLDAALDELVTCVEDGVDAESLAAYEVPTQAFFDSEPDASPERRRCSKSVAGVAEFFDEIGPERMTNG